MIHPERWTIDYQALREATERVRAIAEPVGEADQGCRAIAAPTDPPAYFDDYCRRHFIAWRAHRPATEWEDVAPLYALTAAIHDRDLPHAPPRCMHLIEAQYEHLKSNSRLQWMQAKLLIEEVWDALTVLQGNA
jgi:hypothetical protein